VRLAELAALDQDRLDYARYCYVTGHISEYDRRDEDGHRVPDPDACCRRLIQPSAAHSLASVRRFLRC
jgi:hypothetical protein